MGAFHKAAQANPDSALFRFRLAQALAREGRFTEAASELERAVELDPDNEPAHHQLAGVYRKLGKHSKAIEAAKPLRALGASVDRDQAGLEYRQGVTALERGQLDTAIEHLTRALKAPFDEARFRTTLGIAWQHRGELDAAGKEFHKALQINPRSLDAHLNLGVLLMQRGDLGGAEKEFRTSLEIDPNFAEAHFNLGLVRAAQQRWGEALRALRESIRLNPGQTRPTRSYG